MRLADLFRWCFLGQHLIQYDMRTLAKTRRAEKEGQKEENEIKSFRRKERKGRREWQCWEVISYM